MAPTALLSCDWGTSSFRLRLVEGDTKPSIRAERSSANGILAFTERDPARFEDHLANEVEQLFRGLGRPPEALSIYLSGMITSSLGWLELPYAELPFPLDGAGAILSAAAMRRSYGIHELLFVSGLRSDDDVMRGEETELIGIAADPRFAPRVADAVVVLPGTHSKVVEVSGRAVTAFRSYLTGELYGALRDHTILRHSVGAGGDVDESDELFERGVRRVAADGLLRSLFTVRTNVLLADVPRDRNTAYLSGLLIGAEATSILGRFPPPRPIVLGGASYLQGLYLRAFELLGAGPRLERLPDDLTSTAAAAGHWTLRPVLDRSRPKSLVGGGV